MDGKNDTGPCLQGLYLSTGLKGDFLADKIQVLLLAHSGGKNSFFAGQLTAKVKYSCMSFPKILSFCLH